MPGQTRGGFPTSRGGWLACVLGATVLMPVGLGCSQPGTDDDEMAVTRAALEAQGKDTVEGPTTSALLGTTPKRTRTAVAMLFDIGGPPNQTAVSTLLMGPGTSLTRMYNEVSYGLQQLQIDISGPYKLPVANCLTIACCGPSSDKTGNGATVAMEIAALPKVYDHYFWDYGAIPAGANCGTWGDEGSPATPAKYSSYSFQGITGQAQELGHNLGMTHEPTLKCAGNTTFLDDSTQCTHVEYGSTLSFMGMGGVGYHPSAYHKFAQGWIGGCNVVKVGASGTFNLVPQELACDGAQLLQIAAPKVRPAPAAGDRQGTGPMLSNYYVELRTPIGFDAVTTTRGFKQPMVVISIGADLPTTTRAAPYLYVLDMVPEAQTNLANAGLMTVGQSYADPGGGLTITLTAISAMTATITVTTTAAGANTCVDATPFSAPGMDGTSCSPLATSDGGVITPPADAGTVGDAGSVGTAGRAGGSGGTSGGGGAGGRVGGGTGGAPGTGGASVTGSGGASAGTGGSTATGGRTGSTGGTTGTPGGTGGQPGKPAAGNAVSGGCACSLSATSEPRAELFSCLLLGAVLMARRRSRRGGR